MEILISNNTVFGNNSQFILLQQHKFGSKTITQNQFQMNGQMVK